jgi:hypothetical protein
VQTLSCQLRGRPTEMRQVFSFFIGFVFKSPLSYQLRGRPTEFR